MEISIPRHRTAIRRLGHSRPVALARTHGLISPDLTFFDYGCGFGEDIQLLKEIGVQAEGWDPHYRPDIPFGAADCVNLGYVLNVIEDLGGAGEDASPRLRSGATSSSRLSPCRPIAERGY